MNGHTFPVKASYTGRIILTTLIGLLVSVPVLAMLVSAYLSPPGCGSSVEGVGTCEIGPNRSVDWRANEPGTYTITTGGGLQSVKLEKQDFTVLGSQARADGKPMKITAVLATGTYRIRTAGKGATIDVTRAGASSSTNEFRSGSPLYALPFVLLGAVFLLIPLIYVGELRAMPASFDPEGVNMRNGAKHRWTDYLGLRQLLVVRAGGGTVEKGFELNFRSGKAVLLYRPIDNLDEIGWIIGALKENRNPFAR